MDVGWSCLNEIGKYSICIKCPANCMDCKKN